ncbi:MAG: hypothetical protein H6737_19600 [Alphaproteobacteria bacterium]|nr:hypothetical protein [Alphaproteobacteria bacterium]
MRQYLGYVGAFALGVLVTAGAYEVARIVTNARQALDAASSQMASAQSEAPPAKPMARPVARKPAAPPSPAVQKKLAVSERGPMDPAAAADRRAARTERLRERRRRRWDAMTPEEQARAKALREVRQQRRAAVGPSAIGARGLPGGLDPIDEQGPRDTGF